MHPRNTYIVIGVLISIALLTHWQWFFTGALLTFADWGYYFDNTFTRMLSFPTAWDSGSLGAVNIQASFYPIFMQFALLLHAGFSFPLVERILFMYPLIILSTLGSFFLFRRILGSLLGAFVGSLVYTYNTYFLVLQTAHLSILMGDALLPVALYLFIETLETRRTAYVISTGLVLSVMSYYDFRIFYVSCFVLVLYLFFHIYNREPGWISKAKCALVALIPVVVATFFNAYWIFGLASIGSISSNEVFNRTLFGSNFFNLSRALTLFHPFWTGGEITVFVVQPIPLLFFILPIIATLGMLIARKNWQLIFFSIVALGGIFLAKQEAAPFGSVYPWLYEHFPGFNAFREASKFYVLIMLGYAALVAAFVGLIRHHLSFQNVRAVFVVGLVCFLVWNTYPLITGEYGSLFVERTLPNDYLIYRNYVQSDTERSSRSLWVPFVSRWGFYDEDRHNLSVIATNGGPWKDFESYLWPTSMEQYAVYFFKQSYAHDVLNAMGVRSIVIPIRDVTNDDNSFIYYGEEKNPNIRQWYLDELDAIHWLKRIDIGTEELVVYENDAYKPYLFAHRKLYAFDSTLNLNQKYSFISEQLKSEFIFVISTEEKDTKPLTSITNAFEDLNPKNISSQTLTSTFEMDTWKTIGIYRNQDMNGKVLVNSSETSTSSKITLLGLLAGSNTIAYEDQSYGYENIILNGSFEGGSWQEKVGDCNHYDKDPILSMSLNTEEKTDGNQSLQLEATRHIACTSIRADVASSSTYLLSFDYQSPNAKEASYYVGFNDPTKKHISEALPISDTEWHSFSKTIEIPEGTTAISLFLYARATGGETNIINRYDNVSLIAIPDLRDAFYIVSEPEEKLVEPRAVEFELINPTKKLVHIKGATTPFFLAMSESYHDQWQLQMNNARVHGFFNAWVPFAKPDRVGDEYHYKLNGFLNGWYVDTAELCEGKGEKVKGKSGMQGACTQNADGSYDIEMVIEFWPQRWFYLGLLISGTTLLGCLGYLGYEGVRALRRRYYAHDA